VQWYDLKREGGKSYKLLDLLDPPAVMCTHEIMTTDVEFNKNGTIKKAHLEKINYIREWRDKHYTYE